MQAGSTAVVQLSKIEPQWSDQLTCRPGVGRGVGLAGVGPPADKLGVWTTLRIAQRLQPRAPLTTTQPAESEGKTQLRHRNRKVSKIWFWVCLSGLLSHHLEPPFAGCVGFGSVKSY